jgi:hypothetical protein
MFHSKITSPSGPIVEECYPAERKHLAEGVPSAGLQTTEEYPSNIHCLLSVLGERRVHSIRDGKGHTLHAAWDFSFIFMKCMWVLRTSNSAAVSVHLTTQVRD